VGDIDDSAQWMLSFCEGDDTAFDALFARWSQPLLHYVQRILGEPALAEEVVQEAFLRVYRARDSYKVEARFSTWLYRIGTNLALNELRRAVRKQPHWRIEEGYGEQDGDGMSDQGSSGRFGVVRHLESTERPSDERVGTERKMERVETALGKLPERQRAALWLCSVDGLSYGEVAQVLDTTEKSVKSLVHRGRKTLAELVNIHE
jgi:RNA polymerase sigma-70 factor (ECF subfamily)